MNKSYYIVYTDGKKLLIKKIQSKSDIFECISELSKQYKVLDVTKSCFDLNHYE